MRGTMINKKNFRKFGMVAITILSNGMILRYGKKIFAILKKLV